MGQTGRPNWREEPAGVPLRHPPEVTARRADVARRAQGQGAARRERRLEVRPHAAVRPASRSCTRSYADRGFAVLGFPCNQFGGQEPGTAEEIATFCSTNYGVTFPLFEKIDVNGADAPPALRAS